MNKQRENNNMPDNLKDLLEKPMDRKEFLQHVGVGLIALTGFAALIDSLLGSNPTKKSRVSKNNDALAYGSSAYGGQK